MGCRRRWWDRSGGGHRCAGRRRCGRGRWGAASWWQALPRSVPTLSWRVLDLRAKCLERRRSNTPRSQARLRRSAHFANIANRPPMPPGHRSGPLIHLPIRLFNYFALRRARKNGIRAFRACRAFPVASVFRALAWRRGQLPSQRTPAAQPDPVLLSIAMIRRIVRWWRNG